MRCGKQIALDRLEFRSTHISIAEGAGFNGANRAGRWPAPYDPGTDRGFIQQQSKGTNSLRFVGDGTQGFLYQRGPGLEERATKNRSPSYSNAIRCIVAGKQRHLGHRAGNVSRRDGYRSSAAALALRPDCSPEDFARHRARSLRPGAVSSPKFAEPFQARLVDNPVRGVPGAAQRLCTISLLRESRGSIVHGLDRGQP
jgi:hypothetical protein